MKSKSKKKKKKKKKKSFNDVNEAIRALMAQFARHFIAHHADTRLLMFAELQKRIIDASEQVRINAVQVKSKRTFFFSFFNLHSSFAKSVCLGAANAYDETPRELLEAVAQRTLDKKATVRAASKIIPFFFFKQENISSLLLFFCLSSD